jgi:hypothetical protein
MSRNERFGRSRDRLAGIASRFYATQAILVDGGKHEAL